MSVRIALALSLVGLIAPVSHAVAQEKPKIATTTIQQVPVNDAKGMFESYCATCHGKEGMGNGPAAKALTKAPADLTKLTAKNNGQFPEIQVSRYIQGLDEVAAHGSRDMPMWGPLFQSLNSDKSFTALRVKALSDYIKTLQK